MNLQKILRSVIFTALFLIPVFVLFPMPFWPFNFTNSMFFPFITGKAFYFRALVETAFSIWVILAFLDPRYRPKISPLTIGVTLFSVVALLADLLGVNPLRSIWSNFERMEGWLVVVHLWMFYIVASHTFGAGETGLSTQTGKRLWHRWFNVSLVVASVVSIYALAQLFGWTAIHQGSTRLDASLGNAAYLAVYMLMHIGIAMYMFFVARAGKIANAGFLQWLYPVVAIIFSFIILQTQTRGSIIGLIGGIVLALALYAIFGKEESKKRRWIVTGVIGAIMIISVVFWLCRNTQFIKNIPVLDRIGSISLSDTKTQARAYVWPMALKGFAERPILGWGQENFNYIFNKDYNPEMWRHEQWFDRAHNVFLDWLVASGFIGLVAYLALYVLLLMAIWRSDLKIRQKSVLAGLIAGYAVHNIFVFDNLASYVFFFALLGFGGSLRRNEARDKGRENQLSPVSKIGCWLENKTFSTDAVEYIVAPIVIIVLFAGIYFLNVRPIQANTRLISALQSCSGNGGTPDATLFAKALDINSYMANQEIHEQILSCSGGVINSQLPGSIKQNFFELATQAIGAQILATPDDARIYVLGGTFLSGIGQIEEAEKILTKAHELTPRKPSVTIQLANIYLNKGDFEKSLGLLKEAYELEPSHPESGKAYLIGLIASGDEATARKLFGSDPSVFETDMSARAYTAAKQYQKAIDIYKKLIMTDPKNVQLRVQLSQVYYQANMIWLATETMMAIGKDFPEYKDQVEAAIKQIQAPK